jgi:hypothetical protein
MMESGAARIPPIENSLKRADQNRNHPDFAEISSDQNKGGESGNEQKC